MTLVPTPDRAGAGTADDRLIRGIANGFADALQDLTGCAACVSAVRDMGGPAEIVERVMVAGDGHEAEAAELAAEIRDLDLDDPDYADKRDILMAERQLLLVEPHHAAWLSGDPAALSGVMGGFLNDEVPA